jgi:Trk-type K+ transport system membrane component
MFHIPLPFPPDLVSSYRRFILEVRFLSFLLPDAKLLYFYVSMTDWFFFMVLDIGNPAMDSIPLNVRFIIGLLQAIAVRAAGFGTVALSTLAPAVK